MAKGVSPGVAVYSAFCTHGSAVGSHQDPRSWLPKADCLHKKFKPCPVTPIQQTGWPRQVPGPAVSLERFTRVLPRPWFSLPIELLVARVFVSQS